MIKNSVCVSPQETGISRSVSIFFNQILYLHSKIVWLPKTCRKRFLTYPGTVREKRLKINIFGHFLLRRPLKKVSNKILLGRNMTHLLKKDFSNNVYNRRRIALSKASISSLLDCLCSSSLKYFHVAFSILKEQALICQKTHNVIFMLFLNKPENAIKNMEVYSKKGIQNRYY